VAIVEPYAAVGPEVALAAGFSEAYVKHARIYPLLARLLSHHAERQERTRTQLRLSQALADAELLLSAFLSLTEEAVAVVRSDGTLILGNRAFARLCGRSLGELMQRPVWKCLSAESAGLLRETLGELEAADVYELQLTIIGERDQVVRGRLAVREIGRALAAVLMLRLVPTGANVQVTASAPSAMGAQISPETLRRALTSRRAPSVVVRLRSAFAGPTLARGGGAVSEIRTTMRLALREVVARFAGPADLVIASGEDPLLILGEDGTLVAMRRLHAMLPALRTAFLTAPQVAHVLLLRSGAVSVELASGVCELEVTAAPVELSADDLLRDGLPDLIASRLHAEEEAVGAATLAELTSVRMRASCDLQMIQDRYGAPSALCLPTMSEDVAPVCRALCQQALAHPELALHLNLLSIELALDALAREIDRESALPIVDLHFSVLSQRRLADRFLERCRAYPAELTRSLVVNLRGVPAGAYAPKFNRVASALQELFRLRALTVDDVRDDLVDLEIARIGLLILDYPTFEPLLRERPEAVHSFMRRARRSQARMLVRRAPRGQAFDLREQLGVDMTSAV
jgi:hypothetical protein